MYVSILAEGIPYEFMRYDVHSVVLLYYIGLWPVPVTEKLSEEIERPAWTVFDQ
jgi:hypothetical protein